MIAHRAWPLARQFSPGVGARRTDRAGAVCGRSLANRSRHWGQNVPSTTSQPSAITDTSAKTVLIERDDPVRLAVAKHIIVFAKAGAGDPVRLRELTVKAIRQEQRRALFASRFDSGQPIDFCRIIDRATRRLQGRRVHHEQRAALVLGAFAFALVDFHPLNPMSPVIHVRFGTRENLERRRPHCVALCVETPTPQGDDLRSRNLWSLWVSP